MGVIPARWGSTRFPGKSLALIAGVPLVVRVLQRVQQARRLDEVLVATDDQRIAHAVEDIGGAVVMTRPDHPSGTDRIAEAVRDRAAEVVINIQGDEPLIDPVLIDRLAVVLLEGDDWDMATAATPIRTAEEVCDASVVKVVCDQMDGALYFSRSVIPFFRGRGVEQGIREQAYWRHIGIYAYRRSFLERMVKHVPVTLETAESLEQLRALYMGGRIKVLRTESPGPGVDVPGDVARVEALLGGK
jgi:3-deoxy-manno-octulosonate cytidylyltransferase (CMP-KDO synthetase)